MQRLVVYASSAAVGDNMTYYVVVRSRNSILFLTRKTIRSEVFLRSHNNSPLSHFLWYGTVRVVSPRKYNIVSKSCGLFGEDYFFTVIRLFCCRALLFSSHVNSVSIFADRFEMFTYRRQVFSTVMARESECTVRRDAIRGNVYTEMYST
jgi:hypothetical protein